MVGVRMLVLGGSLFVGREIAAAGMRAGWDVSVFNRGRSASDLTGVTAIRGDRTNADDLAKLIHLGSWDAVVDTSSYVPRNTLDVAALLAPLSSSYLLLSTVSVYEDWPQAPLSESSPILACPPDAGPDFGPPDVEDGPTRYGRLKAGCEVAARAAFGAERVAILRPGVILGPGEYVGRLPWWLRRISGGGQVLAPGSPDRTVQPVDVRDLAAFVITLLNDRVAGAFNVTAPIDRNTFADLLDACIKATRSQAKLVWVPDARLVQLGVRQWSELPLWRTFEGVWKVSSALAANAGLVCRSLEETVAATWAWMSTTQFGPNERSAEIGIDRSREAHILAQAS